MPSEVAEVIEVMTRSGVLMYEILWRAGRTVWRAGEHIRDLAQRHHCRYGLNGEVSLRALRRLSERGVALLTGRIAPESLDRFRQFAASLRIPHAVTRLAGEDFIYVTFRQQDLPLLRPVLGDLQAGRIRGADQQKVFRTGQDVPADGPPPGALHLAAAQADPAAGRRLMAALARRGVHATSARTEGPDAPDPAGGELILYPAAEEGAVRRTISEQNLSADLEAAQVRPAGPERISFPDRCRRLRVQAEEPERVTQHRSRAEPAARGEAPQGEPLCRAAVASGRAAEETARTAADVGIPFVRLDGPEETVFLVSADAGAGLLQALQQAGVAAALGPADAAERQQAQERAAYSAPSAPRRSAPEPPLALLREMSRRGAAQADPYLADFIRLAAANPGLTAKNLFAALGQGASGRLTPVTDVLRAGGATAPGAACIWTGEPRRDDLGRPLRRTDPETGKSAVQVDYTALLAPNGILRAGKAPEPSAPAAGDILAAIGGGAGQAAEETAARWILSACRRGLSGPLADAEAALAACIVLERFSLPLPAESPQYAARRHLAAVLRAESPSFGPFERARQQADAAARGVLERVREWQRQPIRGGAER